MGTEHSKTQESIEGGIQPINHIQESKSLHSSRQTPSDQIESKKSNSFSTEEGEVTDPQRPKEEIRTKYIANFGA